jgi:hypothetical protein
VAVHRVVAGGNEGLYSLVFARCFEAGPSGVDASGVSVRAAFACRPDARIAAVAVAVSPFFCSLSLFF